jgi:hypothetical protein
MSYYFDMAKERTKPDGECPDVRQCMGRLATLEANTEHVISQIADIKSTVGHTDRAIRGNDGLGLTARTASLEDSRERDVKRRRAHRNWGWGLVASVFVGGAGWILRRFAG